MISLEFDSTRPLPIPPLLSVLSLLPPPRLSLTLIEDQINFAIPSLSYVADFVANRKFVAIVLSLDIILVTLFYTLTNAIATAQMLIRF